jgi:hypothetical protein
MQLELAREHVQSALDEARRAVGMPARTAAGDLTEPGLEPARTVNVGGS